MRVNTYKREGKKGPSFGVDFTYRGRRYKRIVGRSLQEAKLYANEIEKDMFLGRFCPEAKKSNVRFSDLAQEYMEKHSRINKRSWKRDETSLKQLLPAFGERYLEDITPKMIEEYRLRRKKQGRENATINREHALLKAMFTKAIHWGYVNDNPAKKVPMAKEKARARFLSKEEIKSLLEAAESDKAPYLRPIIILAITTAMRKGEILSLKWEDVDLDRRVIHIKHTKNDQPREVPIMDCLFETLSAWRKKRLDNCYVFGNTIRQPIISFRTAFEKALKRAGIENFRFHDLRHTAASYMYMSGMDIKAIKEIGGWKTLKMLDRYTHIATAHKRASMLVFESEIYPLVGTNLEQKKAALS
ncbi:tyrosine-type recombinase/integrase [Candidatus Zixiibacteriota bacterium]